MSDISRHDEPAAKKEGTAATVSDVPLRYALAGLLLFFIFLMVKTAWLGDDAYISFRPLDNLLHGYGLRWNIHDRVQVYTDPLWLGLVCVFYACTHEIFLTTIVLSILVSFTAVLLLLKYLADSNAAAIAALVVLLSSKAFIDYTTSGLENALGYLLIVWFCVVLFRVPSGLKQLRLLVLVGSLAVLNRLDMALIFAPPIGCAAWAVWRRADARFRDLLKLAVLYSFPVWGWLLFSLVYFGFLFPNTYYAKLYMALPEGEVLAQGLLYYLNSLNADPVTLLVILIGLGVALRSRDARIVASAIGISLYLCYVVKIGGDFMGGRFFTLPFIFVVALLAYQRLPRLAYVSFACLALVVGLTARRPSLFADEAYAAGMEWGFGSNLQPNSVSDHRGIADERAAYFQGTGLLPVLKHNRIIPTFGWVEQGFEAKRHGKQLAVWGTPGMYAFYGGPKLQILDYFSLGDPLLSKLPCNTPDNWRVGHYPRAIPVGYLESLQTGDNLVENPKIHELYRVIRILTQDPIWSVNRFKEIARMNLGHYKGLIRSIELKETGEPPHELAVYPLSE